MTSDLRIFITCSGFFGREKTRILVAAAAAAVNCQNKIIFLVLVLTAVVAEKNNKQFLISN
jgi:hypothetical protein